METKYAFKNGKHFADLNGMRLAGQLCDVTIEVNGKEFQAHKIVLAANLKYFKLMFLNGGFQENKENVVTMKNLEVECFELFLNYAYTGKITLTKNNALEVLEVANYLDEDTIKKECIKFLKKHMGKSDACRAYQFAKAIEYVPLIKFFEGIVQWILHDVKNRKMYVKDLLNLIDMNKLAPDYIIKYFCRITKDQRDIATDIMMIYHDKVQDLNQSSINERESKTSNLSLMIAGTANNTLKMQFYDFTKQKWCLPREIMYLDQAWVDKCITFHNQLYYTVCKMNRFVSYCTRLHVFDLSTKQNTVLALELRLLRNSAMCACTEIIYFCGGAIANGYGVSNQVLRYDPRTNHFETLPPMSIKRAGAAAIFYQGCILVLGGIGEGQEAINSVEKYDPVTNQWFTFPSMVDSREHFAVALLNGKLYAHGGNLTNYSEVYDPSVNSWDLVAGIDDSTTYPLIIAREGKLLCIIIASGRQKSIRVYDPREDRSLVDKKMSTGLQLNIFGGGLVSSNCVN